MGGDLGLEPIGVNLYGCYFKFHCQLILRPEQFDTTLLAKMLGWGGLGLARLGWGWARAWARARARPGPCSAPG